MSASATAALIERFTDALGHPVSTPHLVTGPHGLERARYRVHRWACPACGAGTNDPIYRPLVIDSNGRVWCSAHYCSAEKIARAVRVRLLEAAA